ncbi:MAG TPA: MCE family protein [Nocardioides sp.]|nr:MCE family protein [Nocardioides sp.]
MRGIRGWRRIAAAGIVLVGLTASGCQIQPNDNTLPGQVAVGSDGYTVTVRFDQVENLVPNSTVQKDDVTIGTVASIDEEDWQAVVTLRLRKDVPLSKDVMFSIGQKTLLGAQYVDVTDPVGAPAAGRLADGTVVPASQTGSYPSTEQVLGGVALLLNNGGLSQISTITGQLSTALHHRVPDTRAFVRDANRLLGVLDRNKGAVVTALDSLNRLSRGLRDDKDRIGTAIDRIAPGLKVLEQERVRLVRALTAAGRASVRAVGVVRASRQALLGNVNALVPILTHLGKASSRLPEALKIGLTIPFPAMTTVNAVRGDYANLFLTLDLRTGSLPDVGQLLGGLPIANQLTDPVQAPLSGGATTSGSTAGGTGKPRSPQPSATSGPSAAPSTPAGSSCLLQLIGLC